MIRSRLVSFISPLLLVVACVPPPDDAELAELEATAARTVDPARELLITDPSVIASVTETTFDPQHPAGTSPHGAWSFGRLIHNMLPVSERGSAAAASRLVLDWLATWETEQAPNPEVDPARPRRSIRTLVTAPWKAASGCAAPADPATDDACVLDLTRAPFQLIAIVNRPDLRIGAGPGAIAGEGRFVFQVVGPTLGVDAASGAIAVMDPTPRPQKFTVIFEYSLPLAGGDAQAWARRWHGLGAQPFGTAYNAKLRAITNGFSGPDQDRARPNGNALDQIRTNEVALAGARFPAPGFRAARQVWELREFRLTEAGLAPHTVNLEPDRAFDVAKTGQSGLEGTRTDELVEHLLADAAAVLAGRARLPAGMSGNSSLVGSAPYGAWGKLTNPNPPAIPSAGVAHALGAVDVAVRDAFALATCAGCHRHETDTRHFMHLTALAAMEPADAVDDRARAGVAPGTPDSATIVSRLLAADVAPGGGRHEDYLSLLHAPRGQVADRPGLRVCAD